MFNSNKSRILYFDQSIESKQRIKTILDSKKENIKPTTSSNASILIIYIKKINFENLS